MVLSKQKKSSGNPCEYNLQLGAASVSLFPRLTGSPTPNPITSRVHNHNHPRSRKLLQKRHLLSTPLTNPLLFHRGSHAASFRGGGEELADAAAALEEGGGGAVLWLYHLGEDLIFYGFQAAVVAANLGGIVPEILGRWVCGEGSAVSAAGEEVLACSKLIMVRFLPAFVVQLFVRILARARFEAREAKKEKEKEKRKNNEKTSLTAIRVESSKEQRLESRGARRRGPKGFMPYAIYLAPPLVQLYCLGIEMKAHHEEGSLEWRVGYVME
uniref:Uncharacterized protein n=1 Tax=Oryza punctata TaxID=4537 RepID=A0A0E0LUV5_ORYPU